MNSLHDFFTEINQVGNAFKLVRETIYARSYAAKVRLHITSDSFIEAYYSPETERKSFALVKSGKRIYGADNKDQWHKHPFGQEWLHIKCKEKTLAEFTTEALELLK